MVNSWLNFTQSAFPTEEGILIECSPSACQSCATKEPFAVPDPGICTPKNGEEVAFGGIFDSRPKPPECSRGRKQEQ